MNAPDAPTPTPDPDSAPGWQEGRGEGWREVAHRWESLYREAVGLPPSEHQARRLEEMAQRVERADSELASLRARVAELEAHKAEWRDAAYTNRRQWMDAVARAEAAETELNAIRRAVEALADEWGRDKHRVLVGIETDPRRHAGLVPTDPIPARGRDMTDTHETVGAIRRACATEEPK